MTETATTPGTMNRAEATPGVVITTAATNAGVTNQQADGSTPASRSGGSGQGDGSAIPGHPARAMRCGAVRYDTVAVRHSIAACYFTWVGPSLGVGCPHYSMR